MINPPQYINLNAFDRSYLIPETENLEGVYFPMSLVCGLTLQNIPTTDNLITAVQTVEQKYPQLRLGYQLNPITNQLVRIPANQLIDYLAGGIKQWDGPETDLAACMAKAVCTNNTPISRMWTIYIQEQNLLFKMHHSFGDAKFLFRLANYMLTALVFPQQFQQLPSLPHHFELSAWSLIWQHPKQGFFVLNKWLQSMTSYTKGSQASFDPLPRAVIVSGSPMAVSTHVVASDVITRLDAFRAAISDTTKISLNTLLQVLIAYKLRELGLLKHKPIYSIPVDLHRYLHNPSDFYPGNLAGQIRVTTNIAALDQGSIAAECAEIQSIVNERLAHYGPLVQLPGSMLLGLNKKAYKRLNREWLMESITTDARWFVLTNLGIVDTEFSNLPIERTVGVHLAVPLMGAPPLVFSFSTLQGQGNFTITYDPQVFSTQQIEQISQLFSIEWIRTLTS